MKRISAFFLICTIICLTGCTSYEMTTQSAQQAAPAVLEGTQIVLSDDSVTVDGEAISEDTNSAVYAANDIVYYEEGKNFTYGEGTEEDSHSEEEADAHKVIHITKAGTYVLSGVLSAGQVAVDLGDGAEEDPEAVVTLVLNGVDITCSVAPAMIFYNVYECGSADTETASETVDTTAAGANVIIADSTENNITGSYVARIYKPESVELNEDGTEVADAKKLHKYDAAFYSKRTMNINGGEAGTGILNIMAENEGLDSELHLTINGGKINITSGNDGINTNEDNVSVTTVNGGSINIVVTGSTGEGDGIDSNGWLVINGGSVTAAACGFSGDAGIDSDMGIHVNGGMVIASGNMLDRLEEGGQNYAVFTFSGTQSGGSTYTLKNAAGEAMAECAPVNDFSILVLSSSALAAGEYTFWRGDTQLAAFTGMGGSMMGGRFPGGMMRGETPPELLEGMENIAPPEGMEFPEEMKRPERPEEKMEFPEGMERPEGGRGGFTPNEDGTITLPDGTTVDPAQMQRPEGGRGDWVQSGGERSSAFTIVNGANYFIGVAVVS